MRRDTDPGFTLEPTLFAWLRTIAHTHIGPHSESTLAEKDFESLAAEWVLVAVWTATAYYGITLTNLVWYWWVGAGLIAGVAVYKLLRGPLRAVLSGFERPYLFAAIVAAIALFVLQVSA